MITFGWWVKQVKGKCYAKLLTFQDYVEEFCYHSLPNLALHAICFQESQQKAKDWNTSVNKNVLPLGFF